MSNDTTETTHSAYAYPLLIKTLLHATLRNAPDQEIVYADRLRYDYLTLHQRIGRLAGALAGIICTAGGRAAIRILSYNSTGP